MSKANIKRLVLLCTALSMLIVFIVFTCILAKPGTNYTDEYKIHLALKELDTIEEVETYLTDNKISYEINASTLTLNDYQNIEYVIHTDNSTGHLIPSAKCLILEKLDAKDYEVVTVEKVATKDGWNENIYLKQKGITYSKYNGEYFIETSWALQIFKTVSMILFIGISVYLTLDYLDLYYKMKKNAALKEKAPKVSQDNKA